MIKQRPRVEHFLNPRRVVRMRPAEFESQLVKLRRDRDRWNAGDRRQDPRQPRIDLHLLPARSLALLARPTIPERADTPARLARLRRQLDRDIPLRLRRQDADLDLLQRHIPHLSEPIEMARQPIREIHDRRLSGGVFSS